MRYVSVVRYVRESNTPIRLLTVASFMCKTEYRKQETTI